MQEAIKAISTMRGHDLSDFQLLAFGGAGPLHAGRIAAELGMPGVVVPLYPGVYSAMGLLMSDVKHDYIRSKLSPLASVTERSEEHTSELQSLTNLVCRLLLEKKKKARHHPPTHAHEHLS